MKTARRSRSGRVFSPHLWPSGIFSEPAPRSLGRDGGLGSEYVDYAAPGVSRVQTGTLLGSGEPRAGSVGVGETPPTPWTPHGDLHFCPWQRDGAAVRAMVSWAREGT